MKKFLGLLLVMIPLLVGMLIFYSIATSDIEDVIVDAVNEESSYLPSGVYEYYLFQYRGTSEDIDDLEKGSGVSFLFDIQDDAKRYQYLEYFISKGISLDKPSNIDGYPPLHAAIIINDPQLVAFLLERGANKLQKDKQHNLTSIEFLDYLNQSNSNIDRSAISAVLSKAYE